MSMTHLISILIGFHLAYTVSVYHDTHNDIWSTVYDHIL